MNRKQRTLTPRPPRLQSLTRRRFLLLAGFAALAVAGGMLFTRRLTAAEESPDEKRPTTAEESDHLERRSITAGGRRIHFLVSTGGPVEPLPVVLVHGLALSGRYLIPTADLLARTHRVYVPDFPGFGDSEKPARVLDVPALADALAAWMDAVQLERAMLLGNSFGCQIIADFAARYPERVAATVLQGPTTPPEERNWLWQFIRWQQNSPYNPPAMEEIAGSDYDKTGYVRALRTFHFSLKDRIEDKLPRVKAPTLVIRGGLDPICNQEWAERVARLLPDSRLAILPEVAHTLVFTSPQELLEASLPFLREAGRMPARSA